MSEVYHGDMVSTAIGILNSMVDADPEAMTALCEHRVHCNAALGDHPTVQVTADCEVGLLGVLNGLFGVIPEGPKKGWGYITAVYDGGVLQRFRRTDEDAVVPSVYQGIYRGFVNHYHVLRGKIDCAGLTIPGVQRKAAS